jgi:hypothetical protein
MKRTYRIAAFAFFFVFIVGFTLFIVSALTDTMTVEANIFAGSPAGGNVSVVRVEVPDYLFFGNVSNGGKSEELKVYVNNTGNVDIVVTPRLTNSSEDIFSNLYFRSTKTRTVNGTSINVNFTKIGDFSFNISEPASGSSFNDEYFYVILDLTNYAKNISQNMMGRRANVKFYAVSQ